MRGFKINGNLLSHTENLIFIFFFHHFTLLKIKFQLFRIFLNYLVVINIRTWLEVD